MEPLFILENIDFAYKEGRRVLQGASFDLHAGERVALTGGNGTGKTTLLHLMVGLHKPQSGTLSAFGRARHSEHDFHEVRCRAGLVFQDPDDQLFSATVAEDVAFGPFNLGWERRRVAEAVDATLQKLDLADFHDRVVYHLSYGEKRLVALASVLVMQPEVLLLDEPNDGLDSAHSARLVDILQQSDCAMLIASHDRDFLKKVTNRAVKLADGGII